MDTEKSFSTERFENMDKNYKDFLDNIIVVKIKSFNEQMEKLNLIEDLINKKFGLVIVDSFTNYYRYEMQKDKYKEINLKAINVLRKLRHVSKEIPVILTSQVYADLKNKNSNLVIGGNMIKNFSDCIIELEKEPKRKIKMLKPENKDNLLEIKNEGVCLI